MRLGATVGRKPIKSEGYNLRSFPSFGSPSCLRKNKQNKALAEVVDSKVNEASPMVPRLEFGWAPIAVKESDNADEPLPASFEPWLCLDMGLS